MYQLYIEQGCPFGNKVMAFMRSNNIEAELIDRDVGDNEAKLIARGGKRQTPYLVDTDTGDEMYESDDIIAYMKKQMHK